MRTLFYLSLSLCLTACFQQKKISQAKLPAQGPSQFTSEQQNLITQVAREFPEGTHLSICLMKGSEKEFIGVVREGDLLSWRNLKARVFEIGSISKVLTSHMLVSSIRKGYVDSLRQPIAAFLPVKMAEQPPITFWHLASHTAGLPTVPTNYTGNIFTYKNPYRKYDEVKLLSYLQKGLEIDSTVGGQYRYSNAGMGLLGYTLARARNVSYESMLQADIVGPLGLTRTTTQRDRLEPFLVPPQNFNGKPTSHWDMGILAGAGGILSTTEDLSKYVTWAFQRLLGADKVMGERTFSIGERYDMALGWHIAKHTVKTPILWHNGGTGGFKSAMGIHPEKKVAVIILTNIGATFNEKKGLIDDLSFDLMNTLL
ncbi:MAG: serine hydrolase domain-containing protein [Bacteroidota bacterium]